MGKLEIEEENVAMKTCYFCQGKVINKRIRHVHHWGDEIVIFENVPAEVCSQCGEVLLRPEVLEKMQQLVWSGVAPGRTTQVPVYDLAEIR